VSKIPGVPAPMTEARQREAFGLQYDPNGDVTVVWVRHGVETGMWPALARYDPPGPVRWFWFSNALVIVADAAGVRVLRRAD